MKISLIILLTIMSFNLFAEEDATTETVSQVTIQDTTPVNANSAVPPTVATDEEESIPSETSADELPTEESADTSSSSDEDW